MRVTEARVEEILIGDNDWQKLRLEVLRPTAR